MRLAGFDALELGLDSLGAPAWLKDPNGTYLAVSHRLASHLSTRRAQMRSRNHADFWPGADVAEFAAGDRAALAHGRVVVVPEHHPRAGYLVTLKLPVFEAGGRPVGTVGVFASSRRAALARHAAALVRTMRSLCDPHLSRLGLRPLPASVDRASLARQALNDPKVPGWLEAMRRRLVQDFRRSHRIQDLARGARVHPSYAGRVFVHHFGESIGAFQARLRTEWCRVELLRSNRTAREIGIDAGFSDQSHFNRVFRAYTGVTPGTYRRRAGRRDT